MKKFVKLLALMLVASMLLACLASCDASGGIKKAYEEAGYEVKTLSVEDDDVRAILLNLYSEDEIEEMDDYEFIYCVKAPDSILEVFDTRVALIIKFPNAGELKDFLVDEDDDSAFKAAEEAGAIKGNCYLLSGLFGADEPFKK